MIKEEKVFWKNGVLTGEGLYCPGTKKSGVVICHPHPLMGGSMHNNVIETLQEVFAGDGYATLRFNFRGVAGSTGSFDEGRGEKMDIVSACGFLKSRGVREITLAGYSFGAWVACRLLAEGGYNEGDIILISPPDKYFDFDWEMKSSAVKLIICGDSDMFCDVAALRAGASELGAKFVMLEATDHFYGGREGLLAECLKGYLYEKKA
jgi:alpha/beta superfamily hydrolase